MSLPRSEAWFPAKRYGWGWGLPQRWQGWLVMLVFFGGLFANALLTLPRATYFLSCVFALSASLLLICLWKGEAPRWSWGDNDDPPAAGKTQPDEPTRPGSGS